MKHLMRLLPLAALVALFTACNSDDSDSDNPSAVSSFTETFTECFNSITDMATGTQTLADGCKYTFAVSAKSDGTATLALSMTGLDLGEDSGIPYTSFQLPALNLDVSGAQNVPYTMTAAAVTPEGTPGATVKFSDVKVRMLRRYNNSSYWPVYYVQFTVNNRWKVDVFAKKFYWFGTTRSTEVASQAVFTSPDPFYTLTLDPATATGTWQVTGARFHERMPAMDMVFPGVTFSCSGDVLTTSSSRLEPEINGVPFPNFPILDLAGYVRPTYEGSLDFMCDVQGMGLYHVSAILTDLP